MENKVKILNYLCTLKTSISAIKLAQYIGVSKRTLSRLIHDINADGIIITSSNEGYKLNYDSYIKSNYYKINSESRITTIIKLLTFSHDPLCIYDLADKLYISDSTIKSDLRKIKAIFDKYDIVMQFKNDYVLITHDEKKERNLIKDFIYGEASLTRDNLFEIDDSLANINIKLIKKTITDTVSQYKLFLDDYTLFNLVLHIVIKIQRTTQSFILPEIKIDDPMKQSEFYLISKVICEQLSSELKIEFNETEVYELGLLFSSSLHKKDNAQLKIEYVSDEIVSKTLYITQYIDDIYGINLNNVDFIRSLSLHLKNLNQRIKNNIITKNPLKDQIMQMYPFIFEISLDVFNVLYPNIRVSEDEICYVALHIATQIKIQELINEKLSCIIISPDFFQLNKDLYTYIKNRFNNEIYIKDIISSADQLPSTKQYDLIISTLPIQKIDNSCSVQIHLIPTQQDFLSIETLINEIKHKKMSYNLSENIMSYFSKKNFTCVNEIMDYQSAIKLSCSLLSQSIPLPENFAYECIDREEISPTTFKDIAIPHPIRCEVNQTSIYVLSNKKYFIWNNKKHIRLIMLLAINKNNLKNMSCLYQYLSNYVNNENLPILFNDVTDYETLINILKETY